MMGRGGGGAEGAPEGIGDARLVSGIRCVCRWVGRMHRGTMDGRPRDLASLCRAHARGPATEG